MITRLTRKAAFFIAFLIAMLPAFSDNRLGADLAAPKIAAFLDTLPMEQKTVYTMTDSNTEQLIALAAGIHINVFEVIDCVFRYVTPRSIRVIIPGSSLRKLQPKFDFGGDRVLSIISINKLNRLEFGARLSSGQKDLDIYLDAPVETYIEIGTAEYKMRYGFDTLKPLIFDGAYGITVKKMILSTSLVKLELFAPGKGAIYVKNLSKPKRWNLDVITPIH